MMSFKKKSKNSIEKRFHLSLTAEHSTVDDSTVPKSQRFNQKSIEGHFPRLICSDGEVDILSDIVAALEPVK